MSDFYDINSIIKKCERVYAKGDIFISYILDENYFPFFISLKKIKQSDIQKNFRDIISSIKKLENSSFCLEYEEKQFKSLGRQNIPSKVYFKTLDDFFRIIKKEKDYKEFTHLYEKIKNKYPILKELFIKKPFLILEYKEIWDELLIILEYILKNPKPNIYIRELSLKNIDTKFIEKHKKIIDILLSFIKDEDSLNSLANYAFEKKYNFKFQEPLIRFRILDRKLYISGLSDITLTLSEFKNLNLKCKKIYIIENKITTLSFPNIKNSIVIFGQGYGVSVLKEIPWFLDKQIYYWGDIDLDGFAILSQVKKYYKNTKSLFMDKQTLEKFINTKVEVKTKNQEKFLENLNEEEKLVYDRLLNEFYGKNIRIEQEKIPFDFMKEFLL